MQRRDPGYGKGEVEINVEEFEHLQPGELVQRLLGVFGAPGYQPPMLPSVAVQLLELTRTPDVPFARIVSLLESEPMLAARILQAAQSAAYGGHRIQSMNDALVRLGVRRITEVFFDVSLGRVFRARGYEQVMEQLRLHATATAHVTRIVCRYTWVSEEYAFLGGLLHDIGLAALLISLANRPLRESPPSLEDTYLTQALVDAHEPAGAKLAELWGLPVDLRFTIGNHHQFTVGGHVHPVAAAVCLADSLVARLGLAVPYLEAPQSAEKASQALQLSAAQLDLVLADAEKLVAKIS
jgi:HD-like signal output (HDOD) protein